MLFSEPMKRCFKVSPPLAIRRREFQHLIPGDVQRKAGFPQPTNPKIAHNAPEPIRPISQAGIQGSCGQVHPIGGLSKGAQCPRPPGFRPDGFGFFVHHSTVFTCGGSLPGRDSSRAALPCVFLPAEMSGEGTIGFHSASRIATKRTQDAGNSFPRSPVPNRRGGAINAENRMDGFSARIYQRNDGGGSESPPKGKLAALSMPSNSATAKRKDATAESPRRDSVPLPVGCSSPVNGLGIQCGGTGAPPSMLAIQSAAVRTSAP